MAHPESTGRLLAQPLGLEPIDISLDFPGTVALHKHRRPVERAIAQHTGGHSGHFLVSTDGKTFLVPAIFDVLGQHRPRLRHPRTDGVDAQIVRIRRWKVRAQRPHEALDAVLGDLVDRDAGHLFKSGRTGKEQDRTVSPGASVVTEVDARHPGDIEGTGKVDINVL